MLTSYLFPHRFKWFGWVLTVLSLTFGLLDFSGTLKLPPLLAWLPPLVGSDNIFVGIHNGPEPVPVRENYDLFSILFIVGALLVACSRERHEDEYISKIRLDALLWSLYIYYALLLLAFLLVSGIDFFGVMMYSLFAPLLLFLVQFQLRLRLTARTLPDEK